MEAEANSIRVKELAKSVGFDLCGITDTNIIPEARDRYIEWIKKGYHGTMGWMEDVERRTNPRKVLPDAPSVIMLALNYFSSAKPESEKGKIARYARGRDYHKTIGSMQKHLTLLLQREFPGSVFRSYVDYGPFMERPYAEKAGLGFIGKNGMLITEQFGSYVFLAEILTSLELAYDAPGVRRCGSCNRCQTGCPTKAFVADGMMDATRCIAYHTIESKDKIPEDIKDIVIERSFGCDICQEVCPYNNRLRNKETTTGDFTPRYTGITADNPALQSDEAYLATFAGTPLMRTKRSGLRKNLQLPSDEAC